MFNKNLILKYPLTKFSYKILMRIAKVLCYWNPNTTDKTYRYNNSFYSDTLYWNNLYIFLQSYFLWQLNFCCKFLDLGDLIAKCHVFLWIKLNSSQNLTFCNKTQFLSQKHLLDIFIFNLFMTKHNFITNYVL